MQDVSNLIRNLLLVGVVSFGAPVVGCTVVEDDDNDAQIRADVDDDEVDLDDDDDVEVEVED
jgi:hypothetical protein